MPVTVDGEVPRELGLGRSALEAAGFAGKVGETLIVPRGDGPTLIAFGIGERTRVDAATLRDAAAALARTAEQHEHIAARLPEGDGVPPATAAQALVEGVVLGRYRYRPLKHAGEERELLELDVVSGSARGSEIDAGIERAIATARAAELARDLANAPGMLLSARKMAEIAEAVAAESGLGCEVFDEHTVVARHSGEAGRAGAHGVPGQLRLRGLSRAAHAARLCLRSGETSRGSANTWFQGTTTRRWISCAVATG